MDQPPPIYRPTARILVFDAQDRLLMLQLTDPKAQNRRFWITPGGGVDPGESFEAGAQRELWEETGIVAPIGPCVWTRRRLVHYDGRVFDFDERFYALRVESVTISQENVTEWERQVLTEYRWWTMAELLATTDALSPLPLPELAALLASGTYPDEPLVLPFP